MKTTTTIEVKVYHIIDIDDPSYSYIYGSKELMDFANTRLTNYEEDEDEETISELLQDKILTYGENDELVIDGFENAVKVIESNNFTVKTVLTNHYLS